MIGKTLAHYEITGPLGKGGMGQVYRAVDTRLDREVALKVLPRDAARDPERRRRFEKEAKAVAALQHPNIVTIYSVDDFEGVHFLTMELVDGWTLAKHAVPGDFSLDWFLELAIPLADAVSCAHSKGITHRDLKPANIMLDTERRVKVLDFGLAKLFEPAPDVGDETLRADIAMTQEGTVLGTPAYMSPEQAEGKATDSRSDVFSLGIILYELATGVVPFHGSSTMATIAAILTETPPQITKVRPGLPQELAGIVTKCLGKDPRERYSSASGLRDALRQLQGAVSSPKLEPATRTEPTKSIAVLPFKNLSAASDTDHFADGLTEDVILDLSKVSRLRVISRASAMRLKETDKDFRTVGRDLNVQFVLEGSVRTAQDRVRITCQLIDVTNDAHVWGERFEGATDDVFAIQEEMARTIVDALKVTLTPDEDRKLHERPIDDVRAHECYVRARQALWRFTEDGLERARRLIQNGLDLVGDNELLLAAMGVVHWQFVNGGIQPTPENMEAAKDYCGKALEAGGRTAQTHVLRACIHMTDGDLDAAIRGFKDALRVDPNDPDALYWLSVLLEFAGHTPKAAPLIERLLVIDPLSPKNWFLEGWGAFLEGDLEKAVEPGRLWHERDPENPIAFWMYASILARVGKIKEARELFVELEQDPAAGPFARLGTMFLRAYDGDRKGTFEAVTPDLVEAARVDWQYSWEVASGYALVDAKDEAVDWLRNSVERGFVAYRFFSHHDPLLANLRQDERFQALMGEAKDRFDRLEA